jgi:hypothetical protein
MCDSLPVYATQKQVRQQVQRNNKRGRKDGGPVDHGIPLKSFVMMNSMMKFMTAPTTPNVM